MTLKYVSMLLTLSLVLGAAPPPETRNDVRCLVASMSLMQSGNDQAKAAATTAAQYFLGRIDGRAPGLDLEAAITQELPMSATDRSAELRRCAALLEKRGAEVQAIGARLTAKGL